MKVSEPFILPEPYGQELRGMSSHFGSNLSDIVMLNFAYEANAYVFFVPYNFLLMCNRMLTYSFVTT